MLEENEAAWGDKVKIIGLSIDKDAATVKNHVTNKGWNKPIHYWRSKSDCSDVYSVKGVPHVMLIDTHGKIVFKGHPANRPDLAADMTLLLAGGEITGEGCAPAEGAAAGGGAGAGKEAFPEGFKAANDDDIAKVQDFMTSFRETGKKMQEECKEDASAMQRAFCVMVLNAKMYPSNHSWSYKFENYRVLVGKQENIDKCNTIIKNNLP